MIGLMDIVEGIADVVVPAGYRVYSEPPKQTDLEQGPLVYVSVMPAAEVTVGGARMSDRTILVDLAYLDAAEVTNADYYAFVADMDRALRPTLRFADREILATGISPKLVDGVGHYSFELKFRDALEIVQIITEQMEKLKIKEEYK